MRRPHWKMRLFAMPLALVFVLPTTTRGGPPRRGEGDQQQGCGCSPSAEPRQGQDAAQRRASDKTTAGQEHEADRAPTPKSPAEGELAITTNALDGRSVLRLDQPIHVCFSHRITPEDFSFRVTPDPGGWEVQWDKTGRHAVLGHKNPFTAGVAHQLELRLKSAKRKERIDFTPYGPSSLKLIAEGEKSSALDFDTAWTYRLRAILQPDSLPARFRSPTPIPCGTAAIGDFQQVEQRLRRSTRDALDPLRVRPTHPDSIYNVIPRWYPRKSRAYPITVWSAVSYAKAEAVVAVIEQRAMYYSFLELLGKEPLSDANEVDGQGNPDHGGDGNLDIYLVPIGADGALFATRPGSRTSPVWILIDHNLSGKELGTALAHELFHAFQYAFDALEDQWWKEATAVWAQDYVGPQWNTEQRWLRHVFLETAHRMETLTMANGREEYFGAHEYGIYLFPYYLSKKQGGDRVIADIWRACEGGTQSLEAIDKVVAGGLDKCFKEFAKLNSDVGPYRGSYRDTNGPLRLYPLHREEPLTLYPPEKLVWPVDLPPLSAVYLSVENMVDRDQTPFIRIDLSDFAKNPKLTVQAIIDPGSKNKVEDWSGATEKRFCVNRKEEDFDEITLVVASAEREDTVHPELTIEVKKEGCPQAVTATLTYRHDETWNTAGPESGGTGKHHGSKHEQVTVRMQFELDKKWVEPMKNEVRYLYKLTSHSVGSSSFKGAGTNSFKSRNYETQSESEWTETLNQVELTNPKDWMLLSADRHTDKVFDVILPHFYLTLHKSGSWKGVRRTRHPPDPWNETHSDIPIDRTYTRAMLGLPDGCGKPTGGDQVKVITGQCKEGDTTWQWQVRRPQHEAQETPDPFELFRHLLPQP